MTYNYYSTGYVFDLMMKLGPAAWDNPCVHDIATECLLDMLRRPPENINPPSSHIYNFIVDTLVRRGVAIQEPETRIKKVFISHVPTPEYMKWISSYPEKKSLTILVGADYTSIGKRPFALSEVYEKISVNATAVEIPWHCLQKPAQVWTRVGLSIPQEPGDVMINSVVPNVIKLVLDEVQIRGHKHLHQLKKTWDPSEPPWNGLTLRTEFIHRKRQGIFFGKYMVKERSLRTRDNTVATLLNQSNLSYGSIINIYQPASVTPFKPTLHRFVKFLICAAPSSGVIVESVVLTPLNNNEKVYTGNDSNCCRTYYNQVGYLKKFINLNKE